MAVGCGHLPRLPLTRTPPSLHIRLFTVRAYPCVGSASVSLTAAPPFSVAYSVKPHFEAVPDGLFALVESELVVVGEDTVFPQVAESLEMG